MQDSNGKPSQRTCTKKLAPRTTKTIASRTSTCKLARQTYTGRLCRRLHRTLARVARRSLAQRICAETVSNKTAGSRKIVRRTCRAKVSAEHLQKETCTAQVGVCFAYTVPKAGANDNFRRRFHKRRSETDGQTDRGRQRDRQTDRETERQTTGRRAGRQTERDAKSQRDAQAVRVVWLKPISINTRAHADPKEGRSVLEMLPRRICLEKGWRGACHRLPPLPKNA